MFKRNYRKRENGPPFLLTASELARDIERERLLPTADMSLKGLFFNCNTSRLIVQDSSKFYACEI